MLQTTRCRPRTWAPVIASLALACPDPGGETSATAATTSASQTTTTSLTTSMSTETVSPTEVTGGVVTCPGDSFEPNDTPLDATPIGDGEFASVICPLDIDYYALVVTQRTYLSVVLYLAREDGTLRIDLVGPDGLPLRASSGKVGVPAYALTGVEALHANLSTPGTYLLQVTHASGAAIPYNFVVQQLLDDTP